jgi:hypothetical protein
MTDLTDFIVTNDVTDNLATYNNRFRGSMFSADNTNTVTISATKELTDNDCIYQVVTTDGSAIELPPEATTNHPHLIYNTSAANTLPVKDDSGATTFVTLAADEWAYFLPVSGEAWEKVADNQPVASSGIPTTGWVEVADTWTYASASTITIPSDGTVTYRRDMKIRWKQGGGYKYAVPKTVAATLITIIVNTDYTVANSAITDVAYSFMEAPYGFPNKFNFTSTITYTGGTTDPTSNTVNTAFWRVIGGEFFVTIKTTLVRGTGNRTQTIFTVPVTPLDLGVCLVMDTITTGSPVKYATNGYFFTDAKIYMQEVMQADGNYWLNGSCQI